MVREVGKYYESTFNDSFKGAIIKITGIHPKNGRYQCETIKGDWCYTGFSKGSACEEKLKEIDYSQELVKSLEIW